MLERLWRGWPCCTWRSGRSGEEFEADGEPDGAAVEEVRRGALAQRHARPETRRAAPQDPARQTGRFQRQSSFFLSFLPSFLSLPFLPFSSLPSSFSLSLFLFLSYLLTCLLSYLVTYLVSYLLTYLLTNLLRYLVTYLATCLLSDLLT